MGIRSKLVGIGRIVASAFQRNLAGFLVTFFVVIGVLLFTNLLRQVAIKEEWVLFALFLVAALGAASTWMRFRNWKRLLSRSVKNEVLGTFVPLGCIFFIIIFLASASRGKWLEAANVLIAALAALWVVFNDLVTDSNNQDEISREKHLLRYSRKATTYMFASLVAMAFLLVVLATPLKPTIKVGVSLPFSTIDEVKNSMPIYEAFRQACTTHRARPCRELEGYRVELVLFDDSQIGSKDCRVQNACRITVLGQTQIDGINQKVRDYDATIPGIKQKLQAKEDVYAARNVSFVGNTQFPLKLQSQLDADQTLAKQEDELQQRQDRYNAEIKHIKDTGSSQSFEDFVHMPNLVAILGPFNSGVAVQEMPALSKLSMPLASSSNTADCLTDPQFADSVCDPAKLDGKGYYFRTISTDNVRNELLARYVHDLTPGGLTLQDVLVFEQSGPKENFFARSFTKTFVAGLHKARGDAANDQAAARVMLVANNTPLAELRDKICALPDAPKVIVYSGTGELNVKIYKAMDCPRIRQGRTKFLSSGSAERFISAPRQENEIYTIDGAIITSEQRAESKLPKQSFKNSREYAALAYDMSNIVQEAIAQAMHDVTATEDPWNLRGFTRNGVNLPKVLALAERASTLPLLTPNHDLSARLNAPLRQAVAVEISQTNTTVRDQPESLTGTYSFNDSGDVRGAAGATVRTFCLHSDGQTNWMKITDNIAYPRANAKCADYE